MVKISIPESFQRVLIGMVFGFVLGVVLYQSSRVQMQEPGVVQANQADCNACWICMTTCAATGNVACATTCAAACFNCYDNTSSTCTAGLLGTCGDGGTCIQTYQNADCSTTPVSCCTSSSASPCDPLGASAGACSTSNSSSPPPPPPPSSSGSSSSAPQCCNAGGTCQAM